MLKIRGLAYDPCGIPPTIYAFPTTSGIISHVGEITSYHFSSIIFNMFAV